MRIYYLILVLVFSIVNVFGKPQVPYDYIPIGRQALAASDTRRGQANPHPSDVNLNYEKLFPSRRKWSGDPREK